MEDTVGLQQGRVSAPFKFLVFIDDLAEELRTRVPKVRVMRVPAVPSSLLFADDLLLLSADRRCMSRALRIVGRWALRWKLEFGRGPDKTASMHFFTHQRPDWDFTLLGAATPWVEEYKYLGVVFDRNLNMEGHLAGITKKVVGPFFQCCAWARREGLALTALLAMLDIYVVPKALYGSELFVSVPACLKKLDLLQRRLGRWILRDRFAPNVVVLGELGWRTWSSLAWERAFGLWARLCSAESWRPTNTLLVLSDSSPMGWVRTLREAATSWGIQPPQSPGFFAMDHAARERYIRGEVRPRILAKDFLAWRAALHSHTDPGITFWAAGKASKQLSAVHALEVFEPHAAAWVRISHGGGWLPGQRAFRFHTGSDTCPLCHIGPCDVWHSIAECSITGDLCTWRADRAQEDIPTFLFQSVADRTLLKAHSWRLWQIEQRLLHVIGMARV